MTATRVDDFGRIIPSSPARSRSASSSRSASPARGRRSRSRSPPRRLRRSLSPRRHRLRGFSPRRHRSPPRGGSLPISLDGPLMSFNQFADAISHTRGRNSSMTVQEQYAKYKDEFILRQDKKFFHQYKDEEWLKEKYHPLCVLQRITASAAGCAARRSAFMESLVSTPNAVAFTLDIPNAPVSSTDEVKFHDNALFIRNLPSTTTRAALTQVLESSDGFVRLVLSEPNRARGFTRYGWAVYSSQAECQAALDQLQGKQVDSWTVLSLIANTPPSRPPKYAPAITLTPERIEKDTDAGIELACKLDHEAGLSNPLQRSVLEVYVGDDGPLKLLNIIQAYLRHVHFSCYYCALCSVDEDELKAKCPVIHRRASEESGAGTLPLPSQESWAKELDAKVASRIASPPSVREDRAVREAALKPFYESMTVFESENKYRCGMCSKLFRGPEFVEKHLKLKHAEECSEEAENRLRKLYFESFRSDPDRPALPPPPPASIPSSTHPRPAARGPDRNQFRGSRHAPPAFARRFPDHRSFRNADFNANVSAPVPEHLKRRTMVSYADLDAPAWSPEKPKKLDYGFGKDSAMEMA